jgi:spore coat polysaccharide biosynthesis protein SpsF (cytidylyltransferase family)
MNVTAIVQARMGSSRLPGKVLADLGGRVALERVIERLRRSRRIAEVVVATTSEPADDQVASVATRAGAGCFRGSSADVLGRYDAAAAVAGADVVVRITADCPLLDPEIVDRVVATLVDDGPCDYASNVIERRYPRGMDAEAMYADVLHRVARLATSAEAREHVTWYILRERPDLFVRRSVVDTEDNADLRFVLDTPDDLSLLRALYADIGAGRVSDGYRGLITHVRRDARLSGLATERSSA